MRSPRPAPIGRGRNRSRGAMPSCSCHSWSSSRRHAAPSPASASGCRASRPRARSRPRSDRRPRPIRRAVSMPRSMPLSRRSSWRASAGAPNGCVATGAASSTRRSGSPRPPVISRVPRPQCRHRRGRRGGRRHAMRSTASVADRPVSRRCCRGSRSSGRRTRPRRRRIACSRCVLRRGSRSTPAASTGSPSRCSRTETPRRSRVDDERDAPVGRPRWR